MPRSRWMIVAGLLLALVAFAALWRFTPLEAWTDAPRIEAWAERLGSRPWTPWAVIAIYTPAALTLFPRPLVTLFAVLALGPWFGLACAFTGIMLAALATYAAGACLDPRTVRHLAGTRFERIAAALRRGGIPAVVAVRLVPIAPFAVVNAVAGAMRIRPAHFLVGSALGILPGTVAATVGASWLWWQWTAR